MKTKRLEDFWKSEKKSKKSSSSSSPLSRKSLNLPNEYEQSRQEISQSSEKVVENERVDQSEQEPLLFSQVQNESMTDTLLNNCLTYVKNKLRNSIADTLLNNCLITFIEKDLFIKVSDNDVLKHFHKNKPRRRVFKLYNSHFKDHYQPYDNLFLTSCPSVVKSYQYTSLTSVILLDCWAIPCVIILAWIFLKTKYGWRKLGGVAVCVVGLVLVVFSDVHARERKGTSYGVYISVGSALFSVQFSLHPCVVFWLKRGSNPLKGDLLVIAGVTLYAVSNVSEEFLVKNADRVELMAMLGVFGAIISAVQISILERDELKSMKWSPGVALPFVGFAVAMFLFYSLVPVLLQMSGSTMLNLSLLTSDMWAVLIRIFAYHEKVDWLYFVALAGVALGLVIYSWGDKVEEKSGAREAEKTGEGSRRHDEEDAGVSNSNRETAADSLRRGPNYDVEHKDEAISSLS